MSVARVTEISARSERSFEAATNEGTTVMQVSGSGQVFLANQGMDIQVMYLEDDAVYCNGASVLAYSASIQADI